MPRISEFIVVRKNETPSLAIDVVASADNVLQELVKGYAKLNDFITAAGEYLADAPYVSYHFSNPQDVDLNALDVEIGFPVSVPLEGAGDIIKSSIPAGKFVQCVHFGPRKHLREDVYSELEPWIKDKGYSLKGGMYEFFYFQKHLDDETNLVTRVCVPIF